MRGRVQWHCQLFLTAGVAPAGLLVLGRSCHLDSCGGALEDPGHLHNVEDVAPHGLALVLVDVG